MLNYNQRVDKNVFVTNFLLRFFRRGIFTLTKEEKT